MVEKQTDIWVFNELVAQGYVNASFESQEAGLQVWAHTPNHEQLKTLLATASKRGTGRPGFPEYIILDNASKLVILIENKADLKHHVYEPDLSDKVAEYAVNGALWYAKFVKDDFDVIAIACSGTNAHSMAIDTYAWKQGVDTFTNLNVHSVLAIKEYRDLLSGRAPRSSSPENRRKLLSDAKAINEFMHGRMAVIEHNRLHVLGSILLALEDPVFKAAYSQYATNSQLGSVLWNSIERKIKATNANEKESIIDSLRAALRGVQREDKSALAGRYPKGTLHELVRLVDKILYNHYEDSELDLVSIFFNIFLSYTTKGGSDLGIVLTPPHVTRLFSDLAEINYDSRVIDPCAGTGGFLATAWRRIALDEAFSDKEKEIFRRENLYGVEADSSIFTVLNLNMLLNRDGSSHLLHSDCFAQKDWMAAAECNVGMLNPPYSDDTYPEILFVEHMLDALLPDAIGIAIVPVNAVSSRTKRHSNLTEIKQRILAKNTLVASIEMPKNLFYPKGTETVVLVFRARRRHSGSTWFAKYDDGFELLKHQGARTPTDSSEIRHEDFIRAYRSQAVGKFSLLHEVSAKDQWVYTLFADEDYEVLDVDLQRQVSTYLSYLYGHQYL